MLRFSRTTRGFVILLAAGLTGCSQDLSRSKAADLIKQHKDFAATMNVRVPVGNIWWDWRMVDDSNPEFPLKTLQASEILTVRETGQKNGYWSKEYITELTPHAKDLAKSWTQTKDKMPGGAPYMESRCYTVAGTGGEPCHQASGVVYSVLLASRKLDAVTGITAADPALTGGAKVRVAEFTWEWSPTADAKLFGNRVPNGPQKGQAAFQLYDDGWRLAQLELNAGN